MSNLWAGNRDGIAPCPRRRRRTPRAHSERMFARCEPRFECYRPSESVVRMIEFVQLVNNLRFALPLSSLFTWQLAQSKPPEQL